MRLTVRWREGKDEGEVKGESETGGKVKRMENDYDFP